MERVLTYPQPHTVPSAPPALPPQLLQTLRWALLTHSIHLSACRGEDPGFVWDKNEWKSPRKLAGTASLPVVYTPLLSKSVTNFWLQGIKSPGRCLHRDMRSVKKYPVTELRSLEVVGKRSVHQSKGSEDEAFSHLSLPHH